MADKKQSIEFTKEQFEHLLKMVYLGNWMANAHRDGSEEDPYLEEYKKIQDYIFSLASKFGFEKYLDHKDSDAIEVSFTDAIPSDYDGVMGVPITFLDKYNPEQFEIVGWSRHNNYNMDGGYWKGGKNDATINGKDVYRRILIKHKKVKK